MTLRTLPFWLVDVFASEPLTGNGLSIFLLDEDLLTRKVIHKQLLAVFVPEKHSYMEIAPAIAHIAPN